MILKIIVTLSPINNHIFIVNILPYYIYNFERLKILMYKNIKNKNL
jgi:hypothetical protein